MNQINLNKVEDRQDKERLALLLAERKRRESQTLFYRLFPDETGPKYEGDIMWARELYPRHLEHFRAGATYRERAFRAANRIGKTVAGAYEITAHLTGMYPEWWEGKRFEMPVRAWAAGKKNESTRDIVQKKLLGEVKQIDARRSVSGTGMIPGSKIGSISWKQGVPNLCDIVRIRHVTGGWSTLGLKSYEQGRGAFEGTEQHVIWLDEEPPFDIYNECLVRTATTAGIVVLTFTPLDGHSETVMQFMPPESRPQPPSTK